MIALAATAVFVMAAFLVMTPTASAADEPFGTYSDIRADSHMAGTGKEVKFTLFATDGTDQSVTYTASLINPDETVAAYAITPGTGTVADTGTAITITAPKEAGMYTVKVEFKFASGEIVTRTAPLKVVVPIVLSATLVNNSGTITDMDVWFVVNGVKVEGSDQKITIGANSTKDVTYEWVSDGLPNGRHTVELRGEVGSVSNKYIVGLNTPQEFFVGQKSYMLTEVLMVVLIIVLLLILLVVVRKPVKNVGKPKARR